MNLQRVINIDIRRCFIMLAKKARILFAGSIVGALCGILLILFWIEDEDRYDAQAAVYSIAYGSFDESEKGISAILAYSDIIKSYKIAEKAALLIGDGNLNKEKIYDMIEVEEKVIQGTTYVYENDSSVIRIHAVSNNHDEAVKVVNAVADAFVMEINGISDSNSTDVLDYAYTAEKSYNALLEQAMWLGICIVAGVLICAFYICYKVIFSDTIVSVKDASLYGQFDIIGAIPKF